jgi:hypothetical protein
MAWPVWSFTDKYLLRCNKVCRSCANYPQFSTVLRLAMSKADRQAVGEDIAYVQHKWPIGKPRVDHLRGPVWEVRSTIGNRIARVLFAADIELALKRLKDWNHGQIEPPSRQQL